MEIEISLSLPPSRLLLTVYQGSRQPAGSGGQASVPAGLFLKALACAGVECIPGALGLAGISHQQWPRSLWPALWVDQATFPAKSVSIRGWPQVGLLGDAGGLATQCVQRLITVPRRGASVGHGI